MGLGVCPIVVEVSEIESFSENTAYTREEDITSLYVGGAQHSILKLRTTQLKLALL